MLGHPRASLDVVEAAYRLDGTEEEWLRGLAEAALPLLDAGLGVGCVLFDLGPDRLQFGAAVIAGKTAGTEDVFRAASTTVPPHALQRVVQTLGEVFGPERALAMARETGLTEKFGVRDVIHVGITDPAGFGLAMTAPTTSRATLEHRDVRMLEQLAAHTHTGLRARRRRAHAGDAVLSPTGHVLHAEGDARDRSAREALRGAAKDIDRARGALGRKDPDAALDAWRAMVAGRWTLLDHFESDGRRFLVARPNAPAVQQHTVVSRMELTCALYAAMGHSGKLIAYEIGLAESTVSRHLKSAMRKLGARSRLELANVLGRPW